MAMAIQNNMAAVNSLNTLNKNSSALAQSLRQISSGQKINSAGDNASGFGISEKMRKQIRSLAQDVANVQTGRNLCKVAAGAVDSIIDELRSLKELALNAANDTNTDADRAIMQKEYVQRRQQIDDIASTTNYNGKILLDGRYALSDVRQCTWSPRSRIDPATKIPGLWGTPDTVVSNGGSANLRGEACIKSGRFIRFDLSFFSAASFPANYSALDKKGFTVACNDCNGAVSFIFDASAKQGTGKRLGTGTDVAYSVGIKGVKNADELTDAIFDGIRSVLGATVLSSGEIIGLHPSYPLHIHRDFASYSSDWVHIQIIGFAHDPMSLIEGYPSTEMPSPLIVHTGTKANQHQRLYFNDMGSEALGIDVADVRSRLHAEMAIDLVDYALEYALNEATTIGAYISRLDTTEGNLTVNHENTTASESVLRDVDMARAMTEYTKNNVLLSAAQSMLAQANQNSSAVMSLLQ